MLVLGIESTCDETACSIVRDGTEILSNVVSSQIDLHKEYGGVVPELACRRHVDIIIPVIDQALQEAKIPLEEIDLFAVANGPGLIGALLIGLNAAKTLALATHKPFIGVNHIEAHLYAAIMSQKKPLQFPCIGVVLSGGHTNIVLIKEIGHYETIGQTVDDAIGEAFDKVAKIMELPYPGGPEIEKLAQKGNSKKWTFKPGFVKRSPLDFSFSGLKTAVLYAVKGQNGQNSTSLSLEEKQDVAASFQSVAFEDVLQKVLQAAKEKNCQTLVFGGGVTNNRYLRELFAKKAAALTQIWPDFALTMDNAAMIAGLGYHTFKAKGHGDDFNLEAETSIPFH